MDPSGFSANKSRTVLSLLLGLTAVVLAWRGQTGASVLLLGGTLVWWRIDMGETRDDHKVAVPDGGTPEIELVVAIIRPGKLNDVKRALADVGAPSLTVTNVSGRGTQPTATGEWQGSEYIVDLHQKVKVECAVTDDKTAGVVDAIQEAAHTGEPGDGKIFVVPVYDACRVSTDERGVAAM